MQQNAINEQNIEFKRCPPSTRSPPTPDLADGRKALKPAEVSGKWPEDTSNPQVHGHLASTRAHAGWFTRRCVELPSTNPTKSIQNQYNNHTTTILHTTSQQPANNHTTTVQQPRLTAYNSAHEPRHDATCDATESPRHETHPPRPPTASPHVPKRPQGRRRRHPPPITAPRRGGAGGDRRPTRRAAPTPKTPTPRTPRAAPVPPLATLRYGAAREAGGPTRRAAPTPRTPRVAPVPPLATLRYGAAGATGGPPEGPPQPRRTPRAAPAPPLVTLRHGATRAPGGPPEGPPLLSKK